MLPHVTDTLERGVIQPASGHVFLSRLLTVPTKDSGKTRLVMDLSAQNKFLQLLRCKMVSVAQIRTVFQKGDWLASLNLQDAYWCVPIHPWFRCFLAF